MSDTYDGEEDALVERLNQELSRSIRRCRSLLNDYATDLAANSSEAKTSDVGDEEGVYYAVRERSERAMSHHASDWRAAAAHAEMADRYEALAIVFGAKRAPEFPTDYL